ncbi:MAG: FtsX-like permease family protein [Sphingobium sp.]
MSEVTQAEVAGAEAVEKASPRTRRSAAAARNRLLPEGRLAGPMPWVIAIMMFLTVLAAAAGLGLANGVVQMHAQLAGKFTVQIVEADEERRAQLVHAVRAAVQGTPAVTAISVISNARLAAQLRPWLGDDIGSGDLPIPALIDVSLASERAAETGPDLRAKILAVAPQARIEAHAGFLAPVEHLMRSLMWLALLLVALMAVATGAVVMLAARGAHDAHRDTIDILHLMGATDVQIARLFQRRLALDALFGGTLGLLCAVIALLILGQRLDATGSELAQLGVLPLWGWAVLPLLPLLGVGLAMITARMTVRHTLEHAL